MNKETAQEKREPSQEVTQVDKEATLEAALRDRAAYNPYVSIYSLTLTALQLVEIYDNQPGKERRFKLLDEIARELREFTGIRPHR